jgi:hypothetical protein
VNSITCHSHIASTEEMNVPGPSPGHTVADRIFLPVMTDREGTLEAGEAASIWRPLSFQAAWIPIECIPRDVWELLLAA